MDVYVWMRSMSGGGGVSGGMCIVWVCACVCVCVCARVWWMGDYIYMCRKILISNNVDFLLYFSRLGFCFPVCLLSPAYFQILREAEIQSLFHTALYENVC